MRAATKETISMANKEEEPKIDLSQLSEEDQKELKPSFPLGWAIFFGVMAVLIIGLIVAISLL